MGDLENPDYDPYAARDPTNLISNRHAAILFLRGSIPLGIFLIARGYSYGGLITGFFGILLIGLISAHTAKSVVYSAHVIYHHLKVPSLSMAEVSEQAFLLGPECVRKLSHSVRILVDVTICVDLVFSIGAMTTAVCRHSKVVVEFYSSVKYDLRIYIVMYLPFVLALNIEKEFLITPFALFSTICTIFSSIVNYYYIFKDPLPPLEGVTKVNTYQELPRFFGIAVFSLTCVNIIFPLENRMRTPMALLGPCGLINVGMFFSTTANALTGFVAYWKYGDEVFGNINLNLPIGDKLAQASKVAVAVSVFISSTLRFHIIMEIIWSYCKEKFTKNPTLIRTIMRLSLIIGSCLIAITIPDVSRFASLIGSSTRSILTMIIPAMIESFVYNKDPPQHKRIAYIIHTKNILIILFGLIIFITGILVNGIVIFESALDPSMGRINSFYFDMI